MAVADVLVSKVLDLLTSVLFNEIEQKVKLVVGVDEEVKMFTSNLESIRAVLIDAEKRQLKEETVKLWLQRLKEISYDIDDVLDEWSTEILRSKIEGDEHVYDQKLKSTKVWSFVLSFCSCFGDVGFRHDIAVKIKELNGRLDEVAKEKERYNFLLVKDNEKAERVTTTSVVDLTEVKGRNDDQNAVRNLLFAESRRNPHVISLVGMGGIGKTTLAKLFFNESSVKARFDKTIWVCVSDSFDEIRIGKAILESVSKSATNYVELQNIVQEIQDHIGAKRVLLVLDDVWNENSTKWAQVEQFLKCSSPGSKILVTTRNENVARVMGCRDVIRLEILSNEECWSIFSQIVFLESGIEHSICLEEIGRKIVDRCKGLPLAVKAIAGLLRFKESIGEWQRVLDSELWEIEEVEREVLAPLWLSYYDLSSAMKQCLLSCVIVYKDCLMTKNQMIGVWMSQGYLRATGSKDMQMVGDEYFQNLAMRSFFHELEEDLSDQSNVFCKMHDVVYDFAQSLMKNKECLNIHVYDSKRQGLDFNNYSAVRLAGVILGDPLPSSFYNLTKLRSLFVTCYIKKLKGRFGLPHIFNKLIFLRSLSLRFCDIREIPSNISKLILLRHLDLSSNEELEQLPETICKLYNLQTLNVDWCFSLKSLPKGIGRLVNLRCLYNKSCFRCLLPKEIERLSGLRRLSCINIGEEEGYLTSLKYVTNFSQLSGLLWIRWIRQHVRDIDVEEAKELQLKERRNLTHLTLCFSSEGGGEWRKEEDGDLLEALEPSPTNLKTLDIRFYQGTNRMRGGPSWLRWLSFLKKLYLHTWTNCEQLPRSLGKLPSLESLLIYKLISLKKVGIEFYEMMGDHDDNETAEITIFPKLINLEFWNMEEWEDWKELEEEEEDGIDMNKKRNKNRIVIMPLLRSLTVKHCPKLKALPLYILQKTSLKLEIWNCPMLQQQTLDQ